MDLPNSLKNVIQSPTLLRNISRREFKVFDPSRGTRMDDCSLRKILGLPNRTQFKGSKNKSRATYTQIFN